MQTRHAQIRAQQRGIPPFIDQLLDQYGHEEYDGRGCVVMYFDKNSIRKMEHDMGKGIVRRFANLLCAYKIRSSVDGCTLTTGHRYKRIRRK
ncbi:MAG: hypothetical protein FWG52_01440 [Proteobacteria bacterium]|nr:hypothetical protein [Pseudomonadota bacterium]